MGKWCIPPDGKTSEDKAALAFLLSVCDSRRHGDLDDYRKFTVMHAGMSSQGLVVVYSFVLLLSSRKKKKKKRFGVIEQENAQIFILKTRMHSPYYAQIKLCNSERTKILEICCQISTAKQL